MNDIFKAGVAPGSPASEDEIKMLLCYILAGIGQPISFTQLYDAMSEDSLVNYFELLQVLERLTTLKHVEISGQDPELYAATPLGREAAAAFEKNLPLTVREKALSATRKLLGRERRLKELRVSQTPAEGGFTLELAIPDEGGDLICIRVFSPTQEHCDRMRRRFLNAPLTIYRDVMALLTEGEDLVGDVSGHEEDLF